MIQGGPDLLAPSERMPRNAGPAQRLCLGARVAPCAPSGPPARSELPTYGTGTAGHSPPPTHPVPRGGPHHQKTLAPTGTRRRGHRGSAGGAQVLAPARPRCGRASPRRALAGPPSAKEVQRPRQAVTCCSTRPAGGRRLAGPAGSVLHQCGASQAGLACIKRPAAGCRREDGLQSAGGFCFCYRGVA